MSKRCLSKKGEIKWAKILKTNYDIAKEEADIIDGQIIDILKEGHSFRVEAGAGSGKNLFFKSSNRVDSNQQNE